MKVKIFPSAPKGEFISPPSKSMAHRMLICAALAKGRSEIKKLAYSRDIEATADCLGALGIKIEKGENSAVLHGSGGKIEYIKPLDCFESGSTLRFLLPLCLTTGEEITLCGRPSLLSRPMGEYEKICAEKGLLFKRYEKGITVRGPLTSGTYTLKGDVSSQFISGLLFALPLLNGDSEIIITPPPTSKPYRDMTVEAQKSFGVNIYWKSENRLYIPGCQNYNAGNKTVEGDWSNAAVFIGLNEIYGGINVTGLDENSLQGDKICREYFSAIAKKEDREYDLSQCPDLGPALFAFACFYGGAKFKGTQRLKIKESDRVGAMQAELEKFGAKLTDYGDRAEIRCENIKAPAMPVDSHNDHRIAMATAMLLIKTGGTIENAQCVSKSMPDFFEKLRRLNVEAEEYET